MPALGAVSPVCARAARRTAAPARASAAAAARPVAAAGLNAVGIVGLGAAPLRLGACRAPPRRSSVRVAATLDNAPGGGAPAKAGEDVFIDPVVGSRRSSNYFWASIVTGGAGGFLITGISAYVHHNLLFFLDASEIQFFPQGLVMSFYGVAGLTLALYLWLTIAWDVGAGYNEFNKQQQLVRIFRYGFPGKDRRINLVSPLKDVRAVRVEVKDGVNPRRVLYLCVKGRQDIPLTRIGQPMGLEELEGRAATLARFLQVPIEGL